MLVAGIGAAQSYGPTNGGKVWVRNNLNQTAQQVVAANPSRVTLTFANPGQQTVYVAPATDAQGNPIALALASLGGSFPVFAGAYWSVSGECQTPWQAIVASGSSQPLTVMESNV